MSVAFAYMARFMVKEDTMHVLKKLSFPLIPAFFVFTIIFGGGKPTLANEKSYPLLANYFLSGKGISAQEARDLARWDVLILGLEVPIDSPKEFASLKRINPDIILYVYIDAIARSEFIPTGVPSHHPGLRSRVQTHDAWLLKNATGKPRGYWPGAQILNPTKYAPVIQGERWNEYAGRFAYELLNEQKGWDGVFYDEVMSTISWLNDGNIDIDNDGRHDDADFIDLVWQEGMFTLIRNARERVGDSTLFMTNGSSQYREFTNGRLYETAFNDTAQWSENIRIIGDDVRNSGFGPTVVVVNGSTNNVGDRNNWQHFRYTLTSTLMTDAYFSFDFGDKWHGQIWWYDEYDADLGQPRGDAYDVGGGVWRRDFDRGLVIINPTSHLHTIDLQGMYQRLDGTQDKSVNNGQIVTTLVVPPYDGIVLKKSPTSDRSTTISWHKGTLTRYRNDVEQWTIKPYDNRWRGSVSMDVGDLDGDGVPEIVLVAGPGGGPHIRIVGLDGKLFSPGFFAFNKNSRDGARMAIADTNDDGTNEIVVWSGQGKRSEVKSFDRYGKFIRSLDVSTKYQPVPAQANATIILPLPL